jgi:hypothetical protein
MRATSGAGTNVWASTGEARRTATARRWLLETAATRRTSAQTQAMTTALRMVGKANLTGNGKRGKGGTWRGADYSSSRLRNIPAWPVTLRSELISPTISNVEYVVSQLRSPYAVAAKVESVPVLLPTYEYE